MNCREVESALADEAIPPGSRGQIDAHVRLCPACRQAQAVYLQIDRTLGSEPAWQPPQGFAARVAGRVADSRTGPKLSWLSLLLRIPPIAAVILAGIVVMTIVLASAPTWDAYQNFAAALSDTLVANSMSIAIIATAASFWIAWRYTSSALHKTRRFW